MLNVAFVYAPLEHQSFAENLMVVDEDFGRLPPLSLAYAAAVAERAGHNALILDANALRLDRSQVIRRLEYFEPDVLAFTLSTYQFYPTTSWMKDLRSVFGKPTVAGGINVRLFPEETLANDAVEFGVTHFGTVGFPALLAAIEKGEDPTGLPETVVRDSAGRTTIGPINIEDNPFHSLPFPARHLLPNHEYYSIISQRKNFTVMMASSGCPYGCRFCAIAGIPRYLNPEERVIEEAVECVRDYGIREIDFFDADFFADRERALWLCRALTGLGLDLEWSCRGRIDNIDREVALAAKRAGCRQIYLGIETPNVDAQRAMRKRIQADRTSEVLALMKEVGIRPLGFFMLGVPGETHASALETIRYSLSLPLDYAQFSRMIAKPDSAMHRELVEKTENDYWRDFVTGKSVQKRLPNIWSNIGEDAIDRYTRLAYMSFYFRPNYVARALQRMRSSEELKRSARTASRMLWNFVRSR